jgi:hypothetical protein
MNTASPFVAVGTAAKPSSPASINPRATRYGVLPIWEHPTDSRAFALWVLPANKVFPCRPFPGEKINYLDGTALTGPERMPADQIADMYTLSPYFIELPELSKVSEEEAGQVVTALSNPNECTKYPFELGRECTTCSLEYLRTHAANADALPDDLRPIAMQSARILINGYEKALDEARRRIDAAIHEVDKPDSNYQFTPEDLTSVYHTHSSRPTYRTSTSGSDVTQQLVEALRGSQAPAIDASAIQRMIDSATQPLLQHISEQNQTISNLVGERQASEDGPDEEEVLFDSPTGSEVADTLIGIASGADELTFGQKMTLARAAKKAEREAAK